MMVRLGEMRLTVAVHRGKVLAIIWQKLQKRGPPAPSQSLYILGLGPWTRKGPEFELDNCIFYLI